MIFEFIIIFILLFIILGLVYQFMYDLYTWALILSGTFYICYLTVKLVLYFRRRKQGEATKVTSPMQTAVSVKAEPKETAKSTVQKEDKDLETLKSFIQKNLKQGFQANVIKEALAKQGWPKDKVEKAFSVSK